MRGPVLAFVGLGVLSAAALLLKRPQKPSTITSGGCQTWGWPCRTPSLTECGPSNPIVAAVIARATTLRAQDQAQNWPLGTTFDEWIDGRLYRFRIEMHGPNEFNPLPHRGVGAHVCMDPSVQPPTA